MGNKQEVPSDTKRCGCPSIRLLHWDRSLDSFVTFQSKRAKRDKCDSNVTVHLTYFICHSCRCLVTGCDYAGKTCIIDTILRNAVRQIYWQKNKSKTFKSGTYKCQNTSPCLSISVPIHACTIYIRMHTFVHSCTFNLQSLGVC